MFYTLAYHSLLVLVLWNIFVLLWENGSGVEWQTLLKSKPAKSTIPWNVLFLFCTLHPIFIVIKKATEEHATILNK